MCNTETRGEDEHENDCDLYVDDDNGENYESLMIDGHEL